MAALLTDIDDETQDDHDHDPDAGVVAQDGIFDLLCLGIEEIFFITYEREPTTVTEFIEAFRVEYPSHAADLWATAFNVGGDAYVASFPEDVQPPGLISALSSPTHIQGIGGSLPCITFEFDPATDDVKGANDYGYILTRNPAGEDPGFTTDRIYPTEPLQTARRRPRTGPRRVVPQR